MSARSGSIIWPLITLTWSKAWQRDLPHICSKGKSPSGTPIEAGRRGRALPLFQVIMAWHRHWWPQHLLPSQGCTCIFLNPDLFVLKKSELVWLELTITSTVRVWTWKYINTGPVDIPEFLYSHMPHVHQMSTSQSLGCNQVLVDWGVLTPQIHQGLICTPLYTHQYAEMHRMQLEMWWDAAVIYLVLYPADVKSYTNITNKMKTDFFKNCTMVS